MQQDNRAKEQNLKKHNNKMISESIYVFPWDNVSAWVIKNKQKNWTFINKEQIIFLPESILKEIELQQIHFPNVFLGISKGRVPEK